VYLSSEAIESGIRTGNLVQGILNVNKHNAMNEAFVRPSGSVIISLIAFLDYSQNTD
jgi:hypothetical protein